MSIEKFPNPVVISSLEKAVKDWSQAYLRERAQNERLKARIAKLEAALKELRRHFIVKGYEEKSVLIEHIDAALAKEPK